MALLCGLGLFTVPVMLYPAGVFFSALLLSAARGYHRPAWTLPAFSQRWRHVSSSHRRDHFCSLSAHIVVSGPQSLFGNPFVRSYSWPDWLAGLGVWGKASSTAGLSAPRPGCTSPSLPWLGSPCFLRPRPLTASPEKWSTPFGPPCYSSPLFSRSSVPNCRPKPFSRGAPRFC